MVSSPEAIKRGARSYQTMSMLQFQPQFDFEMPAFTLSATGCLVSVELLQEAAIMTKVIKTIKLKMFLFI